MILLTNSSAFLQCSFVIQSVNLSGMRNNTYGGSSMLCVVKSQIAMRHFLLLTPLKSTLVINSVSDKFWTISTRKASTQI